MVGQTSKFKLQSSNKLQVINFKDWFLGLEDSLVFDVWCLDFRSGGAF